MTIYFLIIAYGYHYLVVTTKNNSGKKFNSSCYLSLLNAAIGFHNSLLKLNTKLPLKSCEYQCKICGWTWWSHYEIQDIRNWANVSLTGIYNDIRVE